MQGSVTVTLTDGRWVVAGVDRNALRPLRTLRTADNLLIVGSEAGMVVVPESSAIAKGALGPGEMIAIDLQEGRFYEDSEVKARIAAEAFARATAAIDALRRGGRSSEATIAAAFLHSVNDRPVDQEMLDLLKANGTVCASSSRTSPAMTAAAARDSSPGCSVAGFSAAATASGPAHSASARCGNEAQHQQSDEDEDDD